MHLMSTRLILRYGAKLLVKYIENKKKKKFQKISPLDPIFYPPPSPPPENLMVCL